MKNEKVLKTEIRVVKSEKIIGLRHRKKVNKSIKNKDLNGKEKRVITSIKNKDLNGKEKRVNI